VSFYAVGIYEHKAVHRTLMKLSPGVKFINALRAAFMCADPKSIEIQSSCQYLFCAFGILEQKCPAHNISIGLVRFWLGSCPCDTGNFDRHYLDKPNYSISDKIDNIFN